MKVSLIYAYWPNRPFGVTWCDLPWALRDAGIAERLRQDGHELEETALVAHGAAAGDLKGGFELAGRLGDQIKRARADGSLVIVLCGSCCLAAMGAVSGLGGRQTAIAWFDAHPDLNTPETTSSGLAEGMALASALGLAWRSMAETHAKLEPAAIDAVALFGARDVDGAERDLIDNANIPIFQQPAELARFVSKQPQTYIHLDMDVHDALTVRTNSFAVPGGPSVDDVRGAIGQIANGCVLGLTGLDPQAADAEAAMEIAIDHVAAFLAAREVVS